MSKNMMYYAGIVFFAILTLIAIGATVIPLFSSEEWYVRIFDYPRLQTFFIALMALAWYRIFYYEAGRNANIVMAVFAIVIVVQAYKAWPYTPLAGKQVLNASAGVPAARTISLYISNVLQSNQKYELTLANISKYQPSIVITTESNQDWERALSSLQDEYPHQVAVPQENRYGMHLFSRLPLRNTQVRYLLQDDIPSIRTQVQLGTGEWIHLFVVHPRPPAPGEAGDTRQRDAEIILVAKEAKKVKGGVIVAGDFNDVAWSATTELFQEESGFLDPRRGRGFYNTYHAGYPIFRWPLDHIFHSTHFKLKKLTRGDDINSDHFPMLVQLSYEPEDKQEQSPADKDADTREKANQTIREGVEEKE